MAKKIVEVDEDLLKGMMTSDIPLYGRDTERKETEPAPKKAATAEPENISDAPAEREISEQPKSVRNRRKKGKRFGLPGAFSGQYAESEPFADLYQPGYIRTNQTLPAAYRAGGQHRQLHQQYPG